MIKGSRSTVVALVSYTKKKKKKSICGFQSVISTKENSKSKEKEKNIGRKKIKHRCIVPVMSAKL